MKTFAVASIIALATVASAQLDNIPSCAVCHPHTTISLDSPINVQQLNCFIGPLTSDGCSTLTDFACHCKKGTELLATVQPCVQGACSADDQATTIAGVEKTCQDAGVPLEIPDTSSAASSVASSATSAAASAASSAASSASSVVSEASSALESAASSMSSALSSAMSSAASATGAASGSASTTPSASPSQFTGAAAQATQAAGLLGAAALALFAL